jgi:hypothetical protein
MVRCERKEDAGKTIPKLGSRRYQAENRIYAYGEIMRVLCFRVHSIIAAVIKLSVFTAIHANAQYGLGPYPRYRLEYKQKYNPMDNHQFEAVSVPFLMKTVRRDVETCNSDACCDSNYFCQDNNFVCVPCSECYSNSDGVGAGCTVRCSSAQLDNVQYPSLSWLTLSTSKIDASRGVQNVNMMFAVQHDASGLLYAQVFL